MQKAAIDGTLADGFNGANIGRIEDKLGCHGTHFTCFTGKRYHH